MGGKNSSSSSAVEIPEWARGIIEPYYKQVAQANAHHLGAAMDFAYPGQDYQSIQGMGDPRKAIPPEGGPTFVKAVQPKKKTE